MFGDFKRRLRDAALIEEALVKLAAVTEPARLPAVLAEVDRREAMLPSAPTNRHGVDDRVVNEVCDNCGSPLVVVRSREGRFCTSECAEAFELS